ncbi:MAG: ATP synthase F1 subunit gamma [Clostridia bacterium]|nr:ATP synthase F1 subunit gamma [Clostridia bacterium]
MAADMKQLRTRIKSVNSTLHLTKAMGLVASSKIRRANLAMAKSKDYLAAINDLMGHLANGSECRQSPFMQQRGDRVKLIVIAGDRGLAGGYNANVFRFVKELGVEDILPIGKRACDRYKGEFISSEDITAADAGRMARTLADEYLAGKFDRLGIVSTEYISMMTQTPKITWVLPIVPTEGKSVGTVFEPDRATILETAVIEYLSGHIAAAVRESFASEVAARRMAMDSAGKNAQQMIDDLTIQYNSARQGAITQEITEIVAGSGN